MAEDKLDGRERGFCIVKPGPVLIRLLWPLPKGSIPPLERWVIKYYAPYYMYCTPHLSCRGRGGCSELRHVPQSPHSAVGTRSSIGTTHKLLGKLGDYKNYTVMNITAIHHHTAKEKKHTRYTINLRYQLIRPRLSTPSYMYRKN